MHENLDTNQMGELATEGWTQMKDLLQKHGLEEKKKPRLILFWAYRIGGLAACILLAIVAYTFFIKTEPAQKNIAHLQYKHLRTPSSKEENTKNNKEGLTAGKTGSIKSENKISGAPHNRQTPSTTKINIREILESPNTILLPGPGQVERINEIIMTSYAPKIIVQKKSLGVPLPQNLDFLKEPLPFSLVKDEKLAKVNLPVELYAGAGFNISGKRNQQADFNLSQINIHPSLRIVFPLNKKLSLNTGLYAFSSITAREASTEEKELVNNVNANLYYTLNKASILKASYFEIPVTLNYHLSKNWTAGTGLEISRLYQFNVKETEESYDYNENITATNVDRNVTVGTLAAPATKDKISLNKWDPRLVLETTFKTGPLLFSAGYHYGLSPSISINEANGTINHFKNDYYKVGIQYRMK